MTADRNLEEKAIKEGNEDMNQSATTEKLENIVNSLRMLGVILEARLNRHVTVRFPGIDGAPTFEDMLLLESTEEDWPEDEAHLIITHSDELYGTCGGLTVAEMLAHTRLAEASM